MNVEDFLIVASGIVTDYHAMRAMSLEDKDNMAVDRNRDVLEEVRPAKKDAVTNETYDTMDEGISDVEDAKKEGIEDDAASWDGIDEIREGAVDSVGFSNRLI